MNTLAAILCVFLFGLTAPFTRMAALETTPEAIIIRILGAGFVCLVFVLMDQWLPPKKLIPTFIAIASGSVLGTAGHAAVALAGLPLATSIYSLVRDGLNPGIKFWIFAGTGTMSWAVTLTLPVIIPFAIYYFNQRLETLSLSLNGWLSVSYVALVSQSLGMFLWFKVLAIGPMEKVAQVQLLQPFFTLFAAIIQLKETLISSTWIVAGLVALCIFGSNKAKAK